MKNLKDLPDVTTLPNGYIIRRFKSQKYLVDGRVASGTIHDTDTKVYLSINTKEGDLVTRIFSSLVKCIAYLLKSSDERFID